jgi:hypothetical protein
VARTGACRRPVDEDQARAISLAGARTHLSAGHDVVVPQFLARVEFIDQLQALSIEIGARFHEIVLLDDKANLLRRFADRARASAEQSHIDATWLVERDGGEPGLSAQYDQLIALIAARPDARVVRCREGAVERAYQDLLAALA